MDKYITVEASADPKDAAAYTAGDVVGGMLTFGVAAAGAVINGGRIDSLVVTDDDNEKAELTLYLFDSTPTTIADDAAFAPVAADLKNLISKTVVAAADFTTVNALAYAIKTGINQVFNTDGKGNIYGYLVCTATPTYAADKTLHCQLRIETQG
jgi:hypothetical protein